MDGNNQFTDQWKQAAEQFQAFQQSLGQGWTQALEAFHGFGAGGFGAGGAGGIGAGGFAAGLPNLAAGAMQLPDIRFAPEKLQQLQKQYMQEATQLWNESLMGTLKHTDRRFANAAWSENRLASFTAGAYLLNARTLMALVDAVESDVKTKNRLRFSVEQWIAASAPSNYLALNAEAQKKALDTKGESLAKGIQNLLQDMRKGYISMTDESQFEVGKNVATTEGAVVFENDLFQLIEYKPSTDRVYERPFLMVPPCINKYYILDLQPTNSMVKYRVDQGQHTFLLSWRNANKSLSKKTWDDYVQDGPLKAISVIQEITGAKTINALGFCVGGTILTTALAVLAARGEKPVQSLTLLTTLLDFTHSGILDVFIDENMVRYREMEMGKGGLLQGQSLASTFSFLRPNDLVWNYVAGNYLKGETPPAFDLLYWNADATNLPGPFYAWYLRNAYLENNLIKPGKAVVCGEKIDLGKLDIPVYLYGSREDHIVPIEGAYAATQVLPGEKRFVMGASGHIAGVINAPAAKKRSYWTNEQFPPTIDEWIAGATEHPGSWWTDWSEWLAAQSGKQVAAPKEYGNGEKYKASEPAPGRYVKAKAVEGNAMHFLQA